MNNLYIPSRFKRVVALHVIKNGMTQEVARAPLILGIHGPSGDGKTFQCEQVLREMGVKSFLISGGQLESHEAGEPARLVRNTYINASRSLEKKENLAAVILINDVDTGLGSWGEMVQYTINRQTVFGELMHLVDYPTSVEGRDTRRIPIIITGNDFTKLYEPLVRAGRMAAFEWVPTREEKTRIVSKIFPELSASECELLLGDIEGERRTKSGGDERLPVAFYSHLRSTLVDDLLWSEVEKMGVNRFVSLIARGMEPRFQPSIRLDTLTERAKELLRSGQFINHLGRK